MFVRFRWNLNLRILGFEERGKPEYRKTGKKALGEKKRSNNVNQQSLVALHPAFSRAGGETMQSHQCLKTQDDHLSSIASNGL